MRLTIFETPTVADAMAEIRRTLGNDAVIVGTETTVNGVRVTAAVESSASPPVADHTHAPDIADTLYDLLHHHGVPAPIAKKLLGIASALGTDDPALALSGALDVAFSFRPLHIDGSQRRILLVGPPGHGKTVTAARLAARAVLSNRSVRVIAADMTSAGAFAQISELCRPMGIRPQPWSPSTTLEIGEDLAVIDGPGINPFDAIERASIEEIIAATGAEPVLVMAAGNDADEAVDVTAAFLTLGARRLIATRIDAARRLGCILAAAESGLALAEAGVGRTIAETLLAMNPLVLARLLISAAPQSVGTADRGNREKAA